MIGLGVDLIGLGVRLIGLDVGMIGLGMGLGLIVHLACPSPPSRIVRCPPGAVPELLHAHVIT